MSAKSVFKMGFLSMIAATGLFATATGFAADAREASEIQETPGGRWKVVDSNRECQIGRNFIGYEMAVVHPDDRDFVIACQVSRKHES